MTEYPFSPAAGVDCVPNPGRLTIATNCFFPPIGSTTVCGKQLIKRASLSVACVVCPQMNKPQMPTPQYPEVESEALTADILDEYGPANGIRYCVIASPPDGLRSSLQYVRNDCF